MCILGCNFQQAAPNTTQSIPWEAGEPGGQETLPAPQPASPSLLPAGWLAQAHQEMLRTEAIAAPHACLQGLVFVEDH